MKRFLLILFVQIIASAPSALSQVSQTNDSSLRRVEDQLAEVRRDQLNYRLEKDLLKEAYSSNLQIINGVLVFFLGVISLIGFFGIRDINTLKRDYMTELNELRRLRVEFEEKIKEVRNTKEKIEGEVKELTRVNDIQERRIRILELQEKAASLMGVGHHQRALEYIAVGLESDAKNVILLNQKATCLWKSGELHRALATFKEMLNNDPNDLGAAANAMEVALFAGALDDFRTLFAKHKGELDKKYAGELTVYFQVVESYQSGNPRGAVEQIVRFLSAETEQKKRVGTWLFVDASAFFSSKPASQEGDALLEFLTVLNGSAAPQVAREKIEKLFSTLST